MTLRHALSLVLSAATLLLVAGQTQAQIAYTTTGRSLYSFDVATPGTVTNIGAFTGDTDTIRGLDFRPANGKLYGYDQSNNQLVVIDVATAVTTFVSTPTTGSTDNLLGIDFNPAADRLRVVNPSDQNLRINVDTGATTVDGTLAYAAGDPNVGVDPRILEVAYINNDTNAGTGTQLFYIDSALDILATTAAPNAGTLNTVGALGVNTSDNVGFDVFTSSGGGNFAYALMQTGIQGPSMNFYSINLATGAASLIGQLDSSGITLDGVPTFGLAITPVPEPGSLALVATGLVGVVVWRRRKRVTA